MPVGDAQARDPAQGGTEGFETIVPCMTSVEPQDIRKLLERDQFFWLDLVAPSEDELAALRDLFGFHPLALEDALHPGQRPKLDSFETYAFMVFYGASEDEREVVRLNEVSMFISGKYLVSIHDEPLPVLVEQRSRLEGRVLHSEQFLLYRVFDALTDSFFPPLERMDDEIDALESAVLAGPSEEQLQRLFAMKRQLVAMRKVISPQRDLFARSADQLDELPGLELDQRDYFRDIYDHLIRISDLIDSYRDLLSGTTDLYLSTVSNRQNEVMKQLAIVGTIFLPLSFLTGFFGMNFAWLVTQGITSTWSFLVLGVGSMVATSVFIIGFFKRKGWM
jgi:magnesium transporter